MTQQKYGKAQAAVLDADFLHKEIDLKGRLITSIDPLLVQNNFIVMQNMRYGDLNPVSVRGMTLVGNATIAGYNQVVTMKQLRKWEPYETHVYAQINSANGSAIFDQTTALPTAGNWTNVYQIASVYANNTAYAVGDIVLPPTANGFYYECITAGNSGSSPPTFLDANNTTEYSTVNNTVVKFQAIKGNLKGFFADAPQGCLMFCNGRHQLIIPGDRVKLGTVLNIGSTNPFEEVFGLNAEPNGFFYDYTDVVNNKSGTDFATLYTSAGNVTLDANTTLLLHFNGNSVDSGNHVHSVAAANAAYSSTHYKFGNNAASFNNTTGDHFEITANGSYTGDFAWNNTTSWTIDCWVNTTSITANQTIFCLRGNGSNHEIRLTAGEESLKLYLNNNTANTTLSCSRPLHRLSYSHVVAQYNSSDGIYKLFVDGLIGYNSTSSVVISGTPTYFKPLIGRGNNGAAVVNPFFGYIDEFRISDVARYTNSFTVPREEYSETPSGNSANASVNLYIGSPIKLDEVGFKLKTVNSVASTLTVSAYNGTDWENSTSTTDGTNNSTTSMNQSGNIAFNCANAQPTLLKGVMSYWYKFNWTALSNGTSIYYMYGGAPVQQITDLWDGELRELQGCFRWDNSAGHFKDKISSVVKKDSTVTPYVNPSDYKMRMPLTPGTFLSMGKMTSDDYVLTGCIDRAMALQWVLPPDYTGEGLGQNAAYIEAHYTGNTKPSTGQIHYWSGGSFNNTTNYLDGTIGKNGSDNCTMNHDGVMTWAPPDEKEESRTSINQSPELYWYKYKTTATFDANVAADQILYIPAPQKLPTYYTFPVFWLNSIGLCGRNELRLGYPGALNVFNGNGSRVIEIGDASPLVAGGSLPLVHSTGISETLILTKSDETWTLVKLDDDKIKLTKMSDTHGCAAPYTFAVCDLGAAGNNIARAVALWQSSDAILMYMDGNIIDVSKDIKNYFTDMHDANKTVRINPNMINNSTGFFDPLFNEYHWCFAQNNNTTLDKEFVFDVPKQKWFEMVRGNNNTTDNRLTCGTLVSDNNSARYIYAGCADGKIKRLEHNKTFDTLGINCTLQTGFYADGNNTNIISTVRHAKVLFKPILNIANATLYHYHDGNNSVYDTVTSFSMNGSTYFSNTKKSDAYDAEFHGWKLTATLDSSANSTQQDFEPLAITYMYKNKREDI